MDELVFHDELITSENIKDYESVVGQKNQKIMCLFNGMPYDCILIHVNSNSDAAHDVLRKVRAFQREKKSSLETILKLIPKVSASKRTQVVPLSGVRTSEDEPVPTKKLRATCAVLPLPTPPPIPISTDLIQSPQPVTNVQLQSSTSQQQTQQRKTCHCEHIEGKF